MSNYFAAMSGALLLGFIVGVLVWPKIIGWARRSLDEFRGGKCSYCGLETYVTPCNRCGKEVAYCHYYGVLGTDVPNRESIRKRRSSQICTACLKSDEKDMLELLLKR